MFIDVAGDSGVDQSEEGKVPEVPARPAGIPGVSPKHLTVDAQTVADTGSSEDIDSSSDDQVNVDVSCLILPHVAYSTTCQQIIWFSGVGEN